MAEKTRKKRYCPVLRGETEDGTIFKVLVDSAGSASLINRKFIKENNFFTLSSTLTWETKSGTFETRHGANFKFRLNDFDMHKWINTLAYVDETECGTYGMILGMDLITELKLKIDGGALNIEWDGVKVLFME